MCSGRVHCFISRCVCSASMNKNYHYPTLDQLLYCTAAHSQLPGRLWVRYGDSSAPIHENLALNNYLPFKVYYNYSHHLELKKLMLYISH